MMRTTAELINIIVYKILYIVRSKTCEVKYSISEYFTCMLLLILLYEREREREKETYGKWPFKRSIVSQPVLNYYISQKLFLVIKTFYTLLFNF